MSQFYTVTGTCQILCGTLRRRHPNNKLSGAAEGYVFLKDPLGQAKGGTERQGKTRQRNSNNANKTQNIQARRERDKKGLKDQMFVHTRGKETKNKETDLNQRKIVRLNTRPSSTTLILNPKDRQCHPPTRQVALSLKAV